MPLLDEYDVYEQLMTYWHDTMHDDVFLIMNDGWVERRQAAQDHRGQGPQAHRDAGPRHRHRPRAPPSTRWTSSRRALIVARYFAEEQAKLDELNAAAEEATRAVEEYVEEHAVEEGSWPTPWTTTRSRKALATARLRDAKREGSDPDEIRRCSTLIKLYDAEAAAKKAAKDAQAALDLATLKKYGDLTETDVKQLVLDDKWHATIRPRSQARSTHSRSRSLPVSRSLASVTPRPSSAARR